MSFPFRQQHSELKSNQYVQDLFVDNIHLIQKKDNLTVFPTDHNIWIF